MIYHYLPKTSINDIASFTLLSSIFSMILPILLLRLDIFLVINKFIRLIFPIMILIFCSIGIVLFIIFFAFYFLIEDNEYNFLSNYNQFIIILILSSFNLFFSSLSNRFERYSFIGFANLFGVICNFSYLYLFDIININILLNGLLFFQAASLIFYILIFRRLLILSFFISNNIKSFLVSNWNTLRQYIFISTPLTFLNSTILQFPVLYLEKIESEIGLFYYFLYLRFIVSPISLAMNPLSQILLRSFSKINLNKIWQKILTFIKNKYFIILSIFFLFIIYISGLTYLIIPSENKLIFLIISLILLPSTLFSSFISALSNVIPSTGKLYYEAYWKVPVFIFVILILNYSNGYNILLYNFIQISILILIFYYSYFLIIRKLLK